jgi:hypothetical protein
MDFYGVIKNIEELKKELRQSTFSTIERDIIKSKISEAYLLLFEKQETASPTMVEFPVQREVVTIQPPPQPHPLQPPQEREPLSKKPLDMDYKTLVDAFLEKEPPKQPAPEEQSLLSKISQTKIVDLKRSIAMNDRFIFIKELFHNDFDTYNRYINDLNGCETMQQAEQYLTQLKQQYQWDEEHETVQHFMALIGRKFC